MYFMVQHSGMHNSFKKECRLCNGTKEYTQLLILVYKHNELLHVWPTMWPFSGM